MSNQQAMFRQMVDVFETADIPYCILAGYDGLPQSLDSDIDFMVLPETNGDLPGIMAEIASRCDARLIQHLQHETTASYFVLARLQDARITFLHPDSCSDYRRSGRIWLEARKLLRNRVRHAQGFWVPETADAFSYYLIKKLDKQSLDTQQATFLMRRYQDEPAACRARLYTMLPAAEASLIERALKSRQGIEGIAWQSVSLCLPHLASTLHQHARANAWRHRVQQRWQEWQRIWRRLRQPTGLSVVFLGPDGSGKSAVIEGVRVQLSQAFRRIEDRHLFPGRRATDARTRIVTEPHGHAPRGRLGSIVKLLHFWSRYLLGNLFWLYPRQVCSTLVIFDRYYQDLLADPARYRYSAPLALARRLGHWLPQPDLVFILDAPAAVLQSRKQEVPFAESARQRLAYQTLTTEFRHARVIDSAQPLAGVIHDVLSDILDFLAHRTAQRLQITSTRLQPCNP